MRSFVLRPRTISRSPGSIRPSKFSPPDEVEKFLAFGSLVERLNFSFVLTAEYLKLQTILANDLPVPQGMSRYDTCDFTCEKLHMTDAAHTSRFSGVSGSPRSSKRCHQSHRYLMQAAAGCPIRRLNRP